MEADRNVDHNGQTTSSIPFGRFMESTEPVVPSSLETTDADIVLWQSICPDQNASFRRSSQSIIPEDPEIQSPSPPAQYDPDRMTRYLADCVEHEGVVSEDTGNGNGYFFVRERLGRIRERLQPIDRRNCRTNNEKTFRQNVVQAPAQNRSIPTENSVELENFPPVPNFHSPATSVRSSNYFAKCFLDPAIETILDGGNVFVPDEIVESQPAGSTETELEVIVQIGLEPKASVHPDLVDLSFEIPKISAAVHPDLEGLDIWANSDVIHSKENPTFVKPPDSLPTLAEFFDPIAGTSAASAPDSKFAVQNLLFDFDFQPAHASSISTAVAFGPATMTVDPAVSTLPKSFEDLL